MLWVGTWMCRWSREYMSLLGMASTRGGVDVAEGDEMLLLTMQRDTVWP